MVQKYLFGLLILPLLIGVSCDSGDDGPDPDDIDNQIQEYISENNLMATQTASGLFYVIENEGDAPKVRTTDFVELDIRGELINGATIISTFGNETTVKLDLTIDIIAGLDEGLQLLGTGGRATLILPPEIAFGKEGAGNVPGNAVVIYDVQVLGIYDDQADYSETLLSDYIAENNLTAQRTQSGLYVVIEEMGSDTMPTASQTVTVHYHGFLLDGTVFDSSIDRGSPATFSLTAVIPGWTEGIPYFGIGGKGKLLVPSQLAYSSQGTPDGSIPPYSPIAFDIELLDIVF